MPTPTRGPRLGGSPAHQRLLLANLTTSLLEHGRITTTHAKAKRLRPLAEKMITFAKRGDLHARRQVLTVVRDKTVVHELFATIGPRYAERPGGYTRIVKLGPRKGDNAPMALIELVEDVPAAQAAVREGERARTTRFARPGRSGQRPAAVPAELVDMPAEAVAVPTDGGAGEPQPAGAEPVAGEPVGAEPAGAEPVGAGPVADEAEVSPDVDTPATSAPPVEQRRAAVEGEDASS